MKTTYDERTSEPFESGTIYELLECPVCGGILLSSYYWNDYLDASEVIKETLYPSSHAVLRGLPSKISHAYEAAVRVKAIDANAFGVLLRRMLEMVCIDRAARGRTLHEQLRDLATRGEIPGKLADVSMKLKNFGNIGAHAASGELTHEEIPILDSLSRAILEYVYSAPELIRIAEERLAKLRAPKTIVPKGSGAKPRLFSR